MPNVELDPPLERIYISFMARDKLLRGEAGRVAGYDVATFAVRADCGPSYCEAGGQRAEL